MVDTDGVRERIVVAADELFYGRGIQAVGMDQVRERSGVPLKRIYAEFPSKERLVVEVLGARHALWESGIAQSAAQHDDPRDRLIAIYDFLEAWFGDDSFRGCGFINAFGELGTVSALVAESAREHKRSFQGYVAGLVAQLGADPELAPQLALLAEGAQTTAAISGTSEPARHARAAATVLIDAALVHAPLRTAQPAR
jgi:AcrR family transcriptional regulator